MNLPAKMLIGADTSSNEEAWRISDFPQVLQMASEHRLACIGGQFQFRGPIGTAEMYWLEANSDQQRYKENWTEYVQRANSKVASAFQKIVDETDFDSEAANWTHIRDALAKGLITDPKDHLYFVAYFSSDASSAEQGAAANH